MRLRPTVLVCLFGFAATPAAAATCRIDPVPINFGIDVETRMVVSGGTTCGATMTQGGPGRTVAAGGVNALGISQQPQHGRAGSVGLSRWGYLAPKGYVGPDRFVVDIGGEIMQNRVIRGTTHLTVDVDVVP